MVDAEQIYTKSIVVSGASGLIGTAVSRAITGCSWKVRKLVRGESNQDRGDAIRWHPDSGQLSISDFKGIDALVHLAGEGIAAGRWTVERKRRIRESRVNSTLRLCQTLARMPTVPPVLVCASAIGYYGERGDQRLVESEHPGSGFLSEVCAEWEQATRPAVDAGIRVVNLRIGIVLSPEGGALKQMLLPFRLGLGGPIASGRQYWSWISLPDLVASILFAVESGSLAGPVNAVAPNAVTNAEFTRILAQVLRRPALIPLPAFVARLALGEMANELLLASTRVVPEQLQKHGFSFQHGDLSAALRAVLGPDRHLT
jgi:uncharacterized protein